MCKRLREINIHKIMESPCTIWYHLYYLKNVKSTHGGVLLKVGLLHGCFSRFLNRTNSTKSCKEIP